MSQKNESPNCTLTGPGLNPHLRIGPTEPEPPTTEPLDTPQPLADYDPVLRAHCRLEKSWARPPISFTTPWG